MNNITTIGIDDLRFFTGEGKEIPMNKQYSARWEIIPADYVYSAFIKNPSGHFEMPLPSDLTPLFTADSHSELSGGRVRTQNIRMLPNHRYDITVSGMSGKAVIEFLKDTGGKLGTLTPKSDEVTIKLLCNSQGLLVVIDADDYDIDEFVVRLCKQFRVIALENDETKTITEYVNTVNIVVDEPGQIRPSVTFTRSAHDTDYLFDYKLVHSTNGVMQLSSKDSYYRRLTDTENVCYIDDIFNIVFFSYKTLIDDEADYATNTLLLTLNDGNEVITQEYSVLDFFLTSEETADVDRLQKYQTWNGNADMFIEDMSSLQQEQTSYIYGLSDSIFVERLMVDYDQWDEKLFKDLCKTIVKLYKNRKKMTDSACLKAVYSFFRDCEYSLEYWNNEEIIAIIRPKDASGNYIIWDEEQHQEETIARQLIDFLIYGHYKVQTEHQTVARYVLDYNIPESQYPYVRYVGTVYQDKVSAGLISAQTIVVVKDNGEDAAERYTYPLFIDSENAEGDVEYRMHFRFQSDAEMFFVSMSDDVELERLSQLYALTSDEINQEADAQRHTNALHFTVGFETEDEGCYQNTMGIFIRHPETEVDYFLGVIQFRTEVEDEDERYRTLMTNFGIPDPAYYPNVFRDSDVNDDGINWMRINEKSKQLFLTYDQIFPYSGTYKALFNAVKYLGYQDLVFKEWYKLKDSNDANRYVAIQNYDTESGKSIENMLKKYGISYGEYERYTKLNRLSMVYHYQETEYDRGEERLPFKGYAFTIAGHQVFVPCIDVPYKLAYFTEIPGELTGAWETEQVTVIRTGNTYYLRRETDGLRITVASTVSMIDTVSDRSFITGSYTSRTFNYQTAYVEEPDGTVSHHQYNYQNNDIPQIKNLYEYRSDEILSKLYSVKKWLEDYITGVNCYISDINGECIVLERIKTVGYVTQHEVKDITNEGFFTPRAEIKDGEVFTDSSINITCSLNEFRSLTLNDYKDYPIERFIKHQITVDTSVGEESVEIPVYVSAPLNALTVADEYQYVLTIDENVNGSLYEFADKDCLDNPIVIKDGEIRLFNNKKKSSHITNSLTNRNASNECPVILVEKGNIREVYGDWDPESENNNVAWSIVNTYDPNDSSDDNKYCVMTAHHQTYKYKKSDVPDGLRGKVMSDDGEYVTILPQFRFKGDVIFSPSTTDAIFEYTSDNKWQLPLIIVRGYTPTNQMQSDFLTLSDAVADYKAKEQFDSSKCYVIEILEGYICFQNRHDAEHEKFCKAAEITFGESYRDSEQEQYIRIDYTYESDRLPIYEFDHTGFTDAMNGHNNTGYSEFYDKIGDYVTYNTTVDIPVNRLGTYTVSVKAFDSYNNTFVNKSDDYVTVDCVSPKIDVIVNQEHSGNQPDFYQETTVIDSSTGEERSTDLGTRLDDGQKQDLFSQIVKEPSYPVNYKIYSAKHIVDDAVITYDNISYALDTPKANDYILLSNMTEQVFSIEHTADTTIIHMKSSNSHPAKQNIYNKPGNVTVCVYDDNLQRMLYEKVLLEIIDCDEPSTTTTEVVCADGFVEVPKLDISDELKEQVNNPDNNINMYVINATSVEITEEQQSNIINDFTEHTAYIPVNREFAKTFPVDTMVKICVVAENPDAGEPMYINEVACRVTDMQMSFGTPGYVVNTNIDCDFLNSLRNRNIYNVAGDYIVDDTQTLNTLSPMRLKVYMKPLHIVPVIYNLRVDADAEERIYLYGDEGYYAQNTTIRYNPQQLLFEDYFDDSYAATVFNYDPMGLKEIWNAAPADELSDAVMYLYENHPVTVDANRCVIVKPGEDVPQIESGFTVNWKWKSYAIEDNTNWKNRKNIMDKVLLFESNNRILSVKPEMYGPQMIEMYLTDKYGNIISNTAGGNIFVNTSDNNDTVVKSLNSAE